MGSQNQYIQKLTLENKALKLKVAELQSALRSGEPEPVEEVKDEKVTSEDTGLAES